MGTKSKTENYYKAFFENSEMLISLYDENLNLIDANLAFLETLNLQKDDIMGKNISFISPDCIPSGRYKIYQDIIQNGGRYVSEELKLHPSLGGIYIRLSAFKVGNGLGISSKDITRQVETIEDLETFVYKTSHDVRSPISTILGLMNVADTDQSIPPSAKFYFKSIKQQSELLDQIIRRLVDTISIRTLNMHFQELDITHTIDEVLCEVSDLNKFNKIQINTEIEEGIVLSTDHRLIHTALSHLVSNAIKYSDLSKEKPNIDIRVNKECFGIRFLISDNGIGIDEKFLKEAFKMFFRGTGHASGVGLGLFQSKQCIKKLGGRIQLYSQLGLGTCVEVFLPQNQRITA